jgi:hypothetical protein
MFAVAWCSQFNMQSNARYYDGPQDSVITGIVDVLKIKCRGRRTRRRKSEIVVDFHDLFMSVTQFAVAENKAQPSGC